MESLEAFGWTGEWAEKFMPFASRGFRPGRIAAVHRDLYAYIGLGEGTAVVSGRMRHEALGRSSFPVVGDWVALDATPEQAGPATIHGIVPRRNKFSRKVAGTEHAEQPIAANIDTLFVVSSLNRDLSAARLERYLAAAGNLDAEVVVLLTKSDLVADPSPFVHQLRTRLPHLAMHAISALSGAGLEELHWYLRPGRTVAMVGSSGVGKSTLMNRLLGANKAATFEIRQSDDRGRHTTTAREMHSLPGGGLLIDNPGMRELQLWNEDQDITTAFGDIDALAEECYFSDCQHAGEPRCAVQRAIAEGSLEAGRLESFRKLQREAAFFESKGDPLAAQQRKRQWKSIHRAQNREYRRRDQDRFGGH